MITVFVHDLSEEKINEIKQAIINYGAILESKKNDYEVSFHCKDIYTKRLICKEVTRIKAAK